MRSTLRLSEEDHSYQYQKTLTEVVDLEAKDEVDDTDEGEDTRVRRAMDDEVKNAHMDERNDEKERDILSVETGSEYRFY
jgi:hypothetical protein